MSRKKITAVCLSAFVGLVAAGVVWDKFFQDRLFPKRFGIVEPGSIYRSAQLHPALIGDVLQENDIQVVVDLQYWEEKPFIVAEKAAIESLGLVLRRFPLNGDGTGEIESYVSAINEIHDAVAAGEPILVHCAAGTQRTGGVIAAYRTLVQDMTVDEAVAELEQYDWNPVKDRVLLEYLDENVAMLAERLVATGVIPVVPEEMPDFTAAGDRLFPR